MENSDVRENKPQHITELVSTYRQALENFYKNYITYASELPHFIFKSRIVQNDMIKEFYDLNSELEGLLRNIRDDDINGETVRPFNQSPSDSKGHNHHCCCCNYDDEDDEEEEEGWELPK